MLTAPLATYFFPHVMAVVLLFGFLFFPLGRKRLFLWRTVAALTIAVFLAHLDRLFTLVPSHPYFASGHMTFSLGAALSLGLIRRWTLLVTLPLLIPFGVALVVFRFHTPEDVLGAIPIILAVYAFAYQGCDFSLPLDSRPASA